MHEALGLIEVIGYPPAVVAADEALKAANVSLAGITKVDGGIMTVQIFGDVGAVTSAVEAGGMAASKVGTLRATHVIPRVDKALFGTVIKSGQIAKAWEREAIEKVEVANKITKVSSKEDNNKAEVISKENNSKATVVEEVKELEKDMEPITIEELQKKSNMQLKMLIASLGIKVSAEKLKSAKKQDLIRIITDFYKE